jgi:outer membrane protein assembly factor BamE (lipoprotein component of BamABCDE complex)
MTAVKRRWLPFSLPTRLVLPMVFGVIFAACLAVPFAAMRGHPISMTNLARVQVGMTEADVEQALGRPSTVDQRFGRTLWTYESWTWCVVRIGFGNDNTVDEIDHDH